MLQILHGTNIDFMGKRKFAYAFSALMILISAASLIAHGGPRLGIDFTGGVLMQVNFGQAVPIGDVRSTVDRAGFSGSELQAIAGTNTIMIRVHQREAGSDAGERIRTALSARFPGNPITVGGQEYVGPKIGKELGQKATYAIVGALGMILIYIAIRYEWKFALGAVLALAHDVFITLGVLSLCNKEFTLTVMAALLTIAGYSNNDTIVVLDRIRERAKVLRREALARVINVSVNETLSRTVITSLTVTLTVLALFIFGGEVIHDFSFAMLIGVVFGTYSSVYVASALALDITLSRMKESTAPGAARKVPAKG
ncbi:MAG TPA: protein translocase subunit SecF [Candidatus Saccharimonadales bacterium]|nr:protein translocase subunit SecF [Candidatus Saccharimonadales bacterium]